MPSPTVAAANGKQKSVNLMPSFTEEQSFVLEKRIAQSLITGKDNEAGQALSGKFLPYANFSMSELVYMNEPPRNEYLKKPKVPE